METFELEAITWAPHPPSLWKRFVDETFTVIETSQKNELLEHVNSIDKHIQFTAEDQRRDGAMSFLDTLNSTYNEVVFNEMLAIMKQNLCIFFLL